MSYVRATAHKSVKVEVLSPEDQVFSVRHGELFSKEGLGRRKNPSKGKSEAKRAVSKGSESGVSS